MKKKLVFVFSVMSMCSYAQDILVLHDGSTIQSKVVEVGTSEIKYKKWDNLDGPIYSISRKDLLSLNYQNGTKETFEEISHNEKSTMGFIELAPAIGLSKGTKGEMEFKLGFLSSITENLKLGLGAGAIEPFDFDVTPRIPIFVRIGYQGDKSNKASLFCHLDAGYVLNIEDMDYGSIQLNPAIGASFGKVYLGLGYVGYIPTKTGLESSHGLNFKVGYQFGHSIGNTHHHVGLKNFFKRTRFSASVGYTFGTSVKAIYQKDSQKEYIGSGKVADFAWTYKFNDHFNLGFGAGIRLLQMIDNVYLSLETSEETIVPVFARAEYTLFKKECAIRPFVMTDIGYMITSRGYNGEFIHPQIGIKYKKIFASLGLEFTPYEIDDYRVDLDYSSPIITPVINIGIDL